MKETIKFEDLRKLKQHFVDMLQDTEPEGEFITDEHQALVIEKSELFARLVYVPNFFSAVEMCLEQYKALKNVECEIRVIRQFGTVYLYDGEIEVCKIICLKPDVDSESVLNMDFNKALGPRYQMFQK